MNASPDLLKIGEFAKLAETNLRTLRYYEELGLLVPAARSSGGFRYYRATDINRIHMIRDLQDLGLHLDRIRELISTREALGTLPGSGQNGMPCERSDFIRRVRAALVEHDRLLAERVAALGEQRDKVAQALSKIEECKNCTHTPSPENNFCEPCAKDGSSLPGHISALF